MSKQKRVRGLAAGLAAAVLVCGSSFIGAEASAEAVTDKITPITIGGSENTVEPKGSRYVWYVKEENGKTYRRLYDATFGKWVTDWILCP